MNVYLVAVLVVLAFFIGRYIEWRTNKYTGPEFMHPRDRQLELPTQHMNALAWVARVKYVHPLRGCRAVLLSGSRWGNGLIWVFIPYDWLAVEAGDDFFIELHKD